MIQGEHVHNINFVTPDHFFPYVFELVTLLRGRHCTLPMVFNVSGYQSVNLLKSAEEYVDIYLPDFKYADRDLAKRLSKCRDYPDVALAALSVMLSQKGFLDCFDTGDPLARKGVLVRHLILPGYVANSINALTTLFVEFGAELPLSLMSQYVPVTRRMLRLSTVLSPKKNLTRCIPTPWILVFNTSLSVPGGRPWQETAFPP